MTATAPDDGQRWVEVTASQFPHEAEGLAIVRRLLPQAAPFRAWTNFEFRDGHGRWGEVDLLVLGRRRLHLVELKYYSGVLRGDDHRWLRDRDRAEDSPLLLARRKAQRLRSRLQDELRAFGKETGLEIPDPRDVVPYVQESVFLHHPSLRCELSPPSRIDLFGLDEAQRISGLPGISERLLEAPRPDDRLNPRAGDHLAKLLQRIGVQRREREAGSWVIDAEPLAEGEQWQDWPAHHRVAKNDRARIRFFVSRAGAAAEERTRTRRLAEHEFRVMSRLAHEGLLQPRDLVETELGVGLVYPRDTRLERLDLWLAQQPDGVPVGDALALVRQVAETVGYAHRNRVVHRGLTPQVVSVRKTDQQVLRAVVGDWQTAGTTGAAGTGSRTAGVTALAEARLNGLYTPAAEDGQRAAESFCAPEGVWRPDADRVPLDVFALGALAYYVFTRRAPAPDRAGLRERLQRDGGLDLAADLPQVPAALRTLVLEATRPVVSERLADVPAFLARLDDMERTLATPEQVVQIDPLDAVPGVVLDGRFRLERRLGAGSTAVGLLVTDLDVDGTEAAAQRVLKVALDDAAAQRLTAEAEVLQAVRHPRVVKLLEKPLDVGGRRALLLESAGERTLAQELQARPRLSLDLLERWGSELVEALVALDRAGVDHRDVKPANLGVREGRGDHVRHLTLFDFSLARAGATAVTAGTPPYLDPFLGAPGRGRFDSAAERYSAAVVLFEMATGSTPAYGDGLSDPAVVTDEATVEPGQFDAAVAAPLVAFFRTALARDARRRHDTAPDMLAAWQAVFAPLPTAGPADDDADARADAAVPATPLVEAGLSVLALAVLTGLAALGVAVEPDWVDGDEVADGGHAQRFQRRQRAGGLGATNRAGWRSDLLDELPRGRVGGREQLRRRRAAAAASGDGGSEAVTPASGPALHLAPGRVGDAGQRSGARRRRPAARPPACCWGSTPGWTRSRPR